MKRLQNHIAESEFTLPVTAAYTFVVWTLAGLFTEGWWIQLGCLALTAYLMVELSNSNALLRVRSRMVTSTLLLLFCMAPSLFADVREAIALLFFLASVILLFTTYQDSQSQGRIYYAFLCLGLGSMACPHLLVYAPLFWLLAATQLQSMGMRPWLASLLGMATPYWFWGAAMVVLRDTSALKAILTSWQLSLWPPAYSAISGEVLSVVLFLVVLATMGSLHAYFRGFQDRKRVRQLYGFFIAVFFYTLLWLLLQPEHANLQLRLLIISGSPLIAHFFTLTNSKTTNVLFVATTLCVFLLTAYHLWRLS